MRTHMLLPTLSVLGLALLLAGCDAAEPGSSAEATPLADQTAVRPANPGEEVPFKGSCTTVLDPVPAPVIENGVLIGIDLFAEGTCRLTHLGRSHVEVITQIRFADCDFVANVCTTTTPITFTAANGARLFMSGFSEDTPAADPPIFSFTAIDTITGGTGRFSEASGALETEVFVDQPAGRGYFEFDGTFSF